MAAKNRLTAADAQMVADAFEGRLSDWGATDGGSSDAPNDTVTAVEGGAASGRADADLVLVHPPTVPGVVQPTGIDKSMLAVPAPRRFRDREHLRLVAKQPCLIC